MSKRRKGFSSETRVKRSHRVVHGDKELQEKLGCNDLCPCNSGRCFQALLLSSAAAFKRCCFQALLLSSAAAFKRCCFQALLPAQWPL
jgi:hypothetical protein